MLHSGEKRAEFCRWKGRICLMQWGKRERIYRIRVCFAVKGSGPGASRTARRHGRCDVKIKNLSRLTEALGSYVASADDPVLRCALARRWLRWRWRRHAWRWDPAEWMWEASAHLLLHWMPERRVWKEKPVIADWFVVEHTGFDTYDLYNANVARYRRIPNSAPKHNDSVIQQSNRIYSRLLPYSPKEINGPIWRSIDSWYCLILLYASSSEIISCSA